MRGTTAPRLHLELMCARVLLPGADVNDRGVHARLDRLERRIGVVGAATSAEARPAATNPQPAPTSPGPVEGSASTSSAPEPSTTRARPEQACETSPAPVADPPPTSPEAPPTRPEPVEGRARTSSASEDSTDSASAAEPEATTGSADDSAPTDAPASLTVTDVRRLWPEVLEEVKGKRRFTWILLSQNAQVAELRDNTLLLAMANAGARDSFGRGGSEDVLREAIVVVLGADFKIETMVDVQRRRQRRRFHQARQALGPSRASETASAGQQARQSIRPTRCRLNRGRKRPGESEPVDERDAAAEPDDADLDDATVSHTELLARHLGAEIIAEEEHGA